MRLILAIFPTIPILTLFVLMIKLKSFDWRYGAISDLNDQQKFSTLFKLSLIAILLFQTIFVTYLLHPPLYLLSIPVFLIIIALPFSCHSLWHIIPAVLGSLYTIVILFWLSIPISGILSLIVICQFITALYICYRLYVSERFKKKTKFWFYEALILILLIIWNIGMYLVL